MSRRRWPLHPQPGDWEGLETWVRRIAAAYGVSYDTFLRHALGRTGRGARDLEHASEDTLQCLAEGTGMSLERLRGMRSAAIMARVESVSAWMEDRGGADGARPPLGGVLCMTRRSVPDDTSVSAVTQTQSDLVCGA